MSRETLDSWLPADVVELGRAISSESRIKLLDALLVSGPARYSELLDRTDMTTGTMAEHLRKLQVGGVVRKVVRGVEDDVVEMYEVSPFGRRVLFAIQQAYSPRIRFKEHRSVLSNEVILRAAHGTIDFGQNTVASNIAAQVMR